MLYNIGNIDDNLRDLNAKTGTHNIYDPNTAPSTN